MTDAERNRIEAGMDILLDGIRWGDFRITFLWRNEKKSIPAWVITDKGGGVIADVYHRESVWKILEGLEQCTEEEQGGA